MAAALHLDLAIHNFGIQEHLPHNEKTLEVFRTSFTFDEGFLYPGCVDSRRVMREAGGMTVAVDALVTGWAEHGGAGVDAPADQAWGERMAMVRDPDGHLVCLVENA